MLTIYHEMDQSQSTETSPVILNNRFASFFCYYYTHNNKRKVFFPINLRELFVF